MIKQIAVTILALVLLPLALSPAEEINLEAVHSAMKSPDIYARRSACRSLAWYKQWPEGNRKAVVQALGECLSDTEPSVRYWAAFALRAVGPDAVTVLPKLIKVVETDADVSTRP